MFQQNDVIYIGADVHERKTQLAIFEPGGTLLQEERIGYKGSSKLRTVTAREGETSSIGISWLHLSPVQQAETDSKMRDSCSQPKEIETGFRFETKK